MPQSMPAGGSWNDAIDVPTAVTSAGTVTLDLTYAAYFRILLGAATTIAVTLPLNGPPVAQRFKLALAQDATGSRLVTFPTTFRFSGGTNGSSTSPTLTTTASKVDYFEFEYNVALGLFFEVSRSLNVPSS